MEITIILFDYKLPESSLGGFVVWFSRIIPSHAYNRPRAVRVSDASISLFRFQYGIDTVLVKYRDIDVNIDI